MNIILFLDLFTCVGVIVSLNFVPKYYKAWILYMIASFTQLIVCTCGPKIIPGLGLMAAILFFTGFRNYRIAKKLAKASYLTACKKCDKIFMTTNELYCSNCKTEVN